MLNVSSGPRSGRTPFLCEWMVDPSEMTRANVSSAWRARSWTLASCRQRAERDMLVMLLLLLLVDDSDRKFCGFLNFSHKEQGGFGSGR